MGVRILPDKKIKILHVIPALSCGGGVQAWLLAVLRCFDRERFQFDFLPKNYDNFPPADSLEGDLLSLGSRVYRCPEMRGQFPFGSPIRNVLNNSYDILHEHNLCEGSVLLEGKRAGIPVRVIHVHNDVTASLTTGIVPGRWLRRLQVVLSNRYATHGLACSSLVGATHFGRDWACDPRWRLLFVGIDLKPFHQLPDKKAVRDSLGIPEDCFVIGHVGRFQEQKNHPFIVRIMSEVLKRNQGVRLLCIGDGRTKDSFVRQLHEERLADSVILAGHRKDVPALMMGAMDAFLLPSLYEGLPLTLVEAQAAGLPCIVSDRITQEADIVSELIHRLSLEQPAEAWANKLLEIQKGRSYYVSQQMAFHRVLASPFDIRQSASNLARFYKEASVGSGLG
jgi:glycosyltransferase involved in cell wall biosynthesis